MKNFMKWIAAISLSVAAAAPAIADVVRSTVGAEADVKESIADVRGNAEAIFHNMGIVQSGTSAKKSGTEQALEGRKGDATIDVKLTQQGPNQTHVSVTAKEGMNWNKGYAQSVLSYIVQQG